MDTGPISVVSAYLFQPPRRWEWLTQTQKALIWTTAVAALCLLAWTFREDLKDSQQEEWDRTEERQQIEGFAV
jgi:hypothetical protein